MQRLIRRDALAALGAFAVAALRRPSGATTETQPLYFASRKYNVRFKVPDGWVLSTTQNDLPAGLGPRDRPAGPRTEGDLMIDVWAAERTEPAPSLEAWAKRHLPPAERGLLKPIDLTETPCDRCRRRTGYVATWTDTTHGEPIENTRIFLDTDGAYVSLGLSYWRSNPKGPGSLRTLVELARSVKEGS
jgi:hypothetical protein